MASATPSHRPSTRVSGEPGPVRSGERRPKSARLRIPPDAPSPFAFGLDRRLGLVSFDPIRLDSTRHSISIVRRIAVSGKTRPPTCDPNSQPPGPGFSNRPESATSVGGRASKSNRKDKVERERRRDATTHPRRADRPARRDADQASRRCRRASGSTCSAPISGRIPIEQRRARLPPQCPE